MIKTLKTALFPVAGIGRRLLPLTKAVSKELLPVGGLPLIQHAVNEALAAGVERFVFVAGDNLPQLRYYFSPNPKLEEKLRSQDAHAELKLLEELILDTAIFVSQAQSLGLGHAIGCGAAEIDAPFAVILPDDLIQASPFVLEQMKVAWEKLEGENNFIALEEVPLSETSRYGIMKPAQVNGKLVLADGVVEKPKSDPPSHFALMGRYILQPSIFETIEQTPKGKGGEIQITDAIELARALVPLYGYIYDGKRFDCGTIDAYQKTIKQF